MNAVSSRHWKKKQNNEQQQPPLPQLDAYRFRLSHRFPFSASYVWKFRKTLQTHSRVNHLNVSSFIS